MRAVSGWSAYFGTRTAALRLPRLKNAFTGASKPGMRRRYELVDGFVMASSAGACSRRPAMYESATLPSFP